MISWARTVAVMPATQTPSPRTGSKTRRPICCGAMMLPFFLPAPARHAPGILHAAVPDGRGALQASSRAPLALVRLPLAGPVVGLSLAPAPGRTGGRGAVNDP